MSLFTILQMTGSALQSQQAGLRVTANNIANAGTEGYHRQSVDYRTVGSYFTSGLLLGQGVTAAEVVSAYDRFTEERLLTEHSNSGYAQEMAEAFGVLESNVAVVGDGSLDGRLSKLFNSFDALGTTPWEPSVRTQVLIDAESLASEFRRQAEAIANVAETADEAISQSVESVNSALQDVAALNAEIVSLEATGQSAHDLRDQRGWLVDQIASQMDVVLDEEDNGSLTVFLGGHAAVQGDEARTLTTEEDPFSGTQQVVLTNGGLAIDITSQIHSGEIAARLEIRDEVAPELAADLDQIAYDLITNFNTVHATGYDLNGDPGGDIFTAPLVVEGAAITMRLDTALQDNPDGLAAAGDPANVPGDGSIAVALGDLADAQLTAGGTSTLGDALANYVGRLASDTATVNAGLTLQTGITSAVESAWEASAGVSQEEEAVNLIQYQDAYTAMAKVMQVTQEMLDTLMEIR